MVTLSIFRIVCALAQKSKVAEKQMKKNHTNNNNKMMRVVPVVGGWLGERKDTLDKDMQMLQTAAQ